jgi:hypothetical protein
LFAACRKANFNTVNTTQEIPEVRQHRLELARQAMQELSGQANWYVSKHWGVTENEIPAVIKKLRLYGGEWGYKVAAELMS